MTSHRNASGANAPCEEVADLIDGQMPELVPADAEFDVAVAEPSQTKVRPSPSHTRQSRSSKR